MKTGAVLCSMLVASASAFAPQPFGLRMQSSSTVSFAKHANDKAAKWAASKRPKKSRASDINRKPADYELTKIAKPAEYTVEGN